MTVPAPMLKSGAVLATDRVEPVLVRSWVTEGSYAHVYRGAYGRDGVPCAVKLPKTHVDAAVELLRLQGEILSRVRAPGVVRLLDRGAQDHVPFLVLEWLEGGTLQDLVQRRRRLPLRQALEVLEQLSGALAAFHALGLAHGDVRGENVVLEGRGAVLLDPHGLPVGNVPTPSPTGDLQATAALLHLMLTGEPFVEAAPRLTSGAGYRKEVVQLWERLRGGTLTAPELAARAAELRRSL